MWLKKCGSIFINSQAGWRVSDNSATKSPGHQVMIKPFIRGECLILNQVFRSSRRVGRTFTKMNINFFVSQFCGSSSSVGEFFLVGLPCPATGQGGEASLVFVVLK